MSQSPASTEYCIFQPNYYATSMTTGYWVTRIKERDTGDVDDNFFEIFHVIESLDFGFFDHDFVLILSRLVFRVILIVTVIVFMLCRGHSWFEARRLIMGCIKWEDKINLCAFLDLLFICQYKLTLIFRKLSDSILIEKVPCINFKWIEQLLFCKNWNLLLGKSIMFWVMPK